VRATTTTRLTRAGSGESGKSTIVKQMKIIHQNGYTQEELAMYRLTIYKNVIDCAKALIGAMRQFDVAPETAASEQHCSYLLEYTVDPDPEKPLDVRVGEAITAMWRDASVPKVLEHSSEFYLMDSAP
jgi:guanine nucleotide-binding protein G(i) subunit alpha